MAGSQTSSIARELNPLFSVRFSYRMMKVVDYNHEECPACSRSWTSEGDPFFPC